MRFVDRKAKYPGRWTMIKSDGTSEIITLIRNDEPVVEGTPMNANTLNTLSDVAGADIAREKAEAAATVASTAKDAAELAANSSEESKDAAAKSEAAAKQYADNAAAIVSTDPTLTISGAAADAAAVGDRINAIKIETDPTLTVSGAAADAAASGVRIKILEMTQGVDVNGISFVSAFGTLDGVELTGVWNKVSSRVEF